MSTISIAATAMNTPPRVMYTLNNLFIANPVAAPQQTEGQHKIAPNVKGVSLMPLLDRNDDERVAQQMYEEFNQNWRRMKCRTTSTQTDESYVLECRLKQLHKEGQLKDACNKDDVTKMCNCYHENKEDSKRFDCILNHVLKHELDAVLLTESLQETDVYSSMSRCSQLLGCTTELLDSLLFPTGKTRKELKTKCDVCGRVVRKQYLKRHMMLHTGQQPYICEICNKGYINAANLKIHMKTHDKNRERPYPCPDCDFKAYTKTSLKLHSETHQIVEVRPECPICNKSFRSKKMLDAHHKQQHEGNKRTFQCDECGVVYFCRTSLRRHKSKIHDKVVETFPCNECGKVYGRKYILNKHLKRHVEERPYECDVCKKRFTDSKVLKNHSLIHTGEKPFTCEVCGRSFRQKTALKTHSYTHGMTRPHRCDVCGKQFIHKVYLTKHKLECVSDRLDEEEKKADELYGTIQITSIRSLDSNDSPQEIVETVKDHG